MKKSIKQKTSSNHQTVTYFNFTGLFFLSSTRLWSNNKLKPAKTNQGIERPKKLFQWVYSSSVYVLPREMDNYVNEYYDFKPKSILKEQKL